MGDQRHRDVVFRIDPITAKVVRRIPLPGAGNSIAVGHGSVWGSNSTDGTVSRIDPITNTVTAIIPIGTCEEGGLAGVAVDDDAVWVVNHCLAI